MTAAPTPLLSAAVLRTDSESKPRCPEQPQAYDFAKLHIMIEERRKKKEESALHAGQPVGFIIIFKYFFNNQ